MSRPLDKYTKQDLLRLAERLKSHGLIAVMEFTYVEKKLHKDGLTQSAERIAQLNDAVWDALIFAAESKED